MKRAAFLWSVALDTLWHTALWTIINCHSREGVNNDENSKSTFNWTSTPSSSNVVLRWRPYWKAHVTWNDVLHALTEHWIHAPTRSRHREHSSAHRLAYIHQRATTGLSGLAVACLTAMHEVLGSNCSVGSGVYCKNHCDVQPWAWSVCTLPAVPKSTQPSTLFRMMEWYSLFVLKVQANK